MSLRVATEDDAGAANDLMRASVQALFPGYYDQRASLGGSWQFLLASVCQGLNSSASDSP
jgi:hypothetical protein